MFWHAKDFDKYLEFFEKDYLADIFYEMKLLKGEKIDNETLSHISLLPYKHVLPHGTYFIEER